MSEQKAKTSKDIQSDFNNLAFRAGHLQHDIYNKEKELKMFNESLRDLQVEYNKVKQEEDLVAKAVAEAQAAGQKSPEPALKAVE